MAQMKDGCVKPARGPIATAGAPGDHLHSERIGQVAMLRAQVGKEAPDFEANAFVEGVGFQPVRLSSYRGQWLVLCYQPGDFTFV